MTIPKIDFPIYIVIIILAILMGYLYIYLILKKEKKLDKNMFLYFFLSTLLIFFLGKTFTMIFEGVSFLEAGLSSYGCSLGIILSTLLFELIMPLKGVLFKTVFMSLPLIYGISKIGCFLTGCCYGIPYDGVFLVTYVNGLNIPVFPIQILETIVFLLIFLVFNKLKSKKNIEYITIIICAIFKFFLDFLRYDHLEHIITTNQIFSLIVLVLFIFIILKEKLKKHL